MLQKLDHFRRSVELSGRRFLTWLTGLLLGRSGTADQNILSVSSPRILVVRLDPRVGNAIMTLPLLDALKSQWPGSTVDLLAGAHLRQLIGGYPHLDGFYSYHKGRIFAASGPLRGKQY